jgi:hypothetical protein
MTHDNVAKQGTVNDIDLESDEVSFDLNNRHQWNWFEVGRGQAKNYAMGSVHQFKSVPCDRCHEPISVPPTADERRDVTCDLCMAVLHKMAEAELNALIKAHPEADGEELIFLAMQGKADGILPIN